MKREFKIGDKVKLTDVYRMTGTGKILDIKGFGIFKRYAVEYSEEFEHVQWFCKGRLVRYSEDVQ